MNRPFYAIGILLAALAASMLLVSAPGPRAPARPAKLRQNPAPAENSVRQSRAGRGGVFVIVLAEEPELEPQYFYTSGCGLDRTTGEIYAEPLIVRLPPVPVHTVTDLPSARPAGPDFRSHYDAAYDAAVYAPSQTWDAVQLDEIEPALHLMRDVIRQLPPDPRRPKAPRDRLAEAAGQSQAPTWEDYEGWCDSLHSVAKQDVVAEEDAVAERSGRASDSAQDSAQLSRQALQYAAKALNHVAELLRAAAEELERSGNPSVASKPENSPAGESQK